jgi:hypothetical protein
VTSLRTWGVVRALVTFLAGLASGMWTSALGFHPQAPRGAFADYRELLVETFHLSPEREQALGVVLASYQKEIEEIKDQHMAEYMSAMEPELRSRGRYYRDLIQNRVLPEERRAEFDSPKYVQVWPAPRP